jgi:quinol monooxygenase YgiN
MVKLALYVHMEVAPGKEEELETFLKDGLALVGEEPGTRTWYAIRTGPGSYGIFDTFSDDSGRDAHLNGKVAQALMARAGELFAKPPSIQKVDVLAAKIAG